MDSHRNDIWLVEQIDRLIRLSKSDWMKLKKQIKKLSIRETAEARGCRASQVCRIQSIYRKETPV